MYDKAGRVRVSFQSYVSNGILDGRECKVDERPGGQEALPPFTSGSIVNRTGRGRHQIHHQMGQGKLVNSMSGSPTQQRTIGVAPLPDKTGNSRKDPVTNRTSVMGGEASVQKELGCFVDNWQRE